MRGSGDRREYGARGKKSWRVARSWHRSLEDDKGREGISEVNASMGLGRDELPRQGEAGTRRVSGFAGRAPPGRAEGVGSPGEVGIEGGFGGRTNRVFSGEH